MLNAMAHGGPDAEGVYFDGPVVFGHRRLSIIDLSIAGNQPMISADSEVIISFNGEIYNFMNIRRSLEDLGVFFTTKSDTEVILQAYQAWGTKAFDLFEGIFAFAIYDKKKGKVFLVRDHIGIKPLYYYIKDGKLIFSSEVRGFKSMNPEWPEFEDWKILFLAFGSIPHPYTTLMDVHQLPAGSYLELTLNDFSNEVHTYYSESNTSVIPSNSSEDLKTMQFAIQDAIRRNMISDAPIGIFLSGGIDSSLLVLLADRIRSGVNTISINFDEGYYDEHQYQQLALEETLNVDHTSHRITEQMFWDNLDDFWKAMDQPSIDGVNSYFSAKSARKDGLKVALSGLGADEIFGGYPSFKRITWLKRIRNLPFKRLIGKIMGWKNHAYRRIMFLNLPGIIGDYLFLRGIHTPDFIASILHVPEERVWKALQKVKIDFSPKSEDMDYVSRLESKIYMTNQLLKDTDCMGMWHGLEIRVPFLDIDLIKKVESIPPAQRYKQGWPKYLLTASNQHILPPKIIFRKKKGFTFPLETWMRVSKNRFRNLIKMENGVIKIVKSFENGQGHWSKYWSLIVLHKFGPEANPRGTPIKKPIN